MDFYEALKEGATTTELLNAFYKELDDAAKRIEKEKAEEEAKEAEKRSKAKQHALEIARNDLILALYEYAKILSDKPLKNFNPEELKAYFIEFEEAFKDLKQMSDDIISSFSNKKNKKEHYNKIFTTKMEQDNEIIKNFLDSLK